jgi:hypothetical protein
MPNDPRVAQLLDDILESDRSPEEVCRTCPELLSSVREGLRQIRLLEAALDALPSQHGTASTRRFWINDRRPGPACLGVRNRVGAWPWRHGSCLQSSPAEPRSDGRAQDAARGPLRRPARATSISARSRGDCPYDPSLANDVGRSHRYKAARMAALAGCGQGTDAAGLGEPDRKHRRDQARRWLRADLTAWAQLLDNTSLFRDKARETLLAWQGDADVAGLREPAALGQFRDDERSDCLALWDEVAKAFKRTYGSR